METAILLLILAALVLIVVYLTIGQKDSPPTVVPAPAIAAPPVLATEVAPPLPVAPPAVEPSVAAPVITSSTPAPEVVEAPKPKKSARRRTPVEPAPVPASGVVAALAMLQQPDALTTALILREIFDKPIALRNQRPSRRAEPRQGPG